MLLEAAILASAVVAAPPRLVTQLETSVEAGLFPLVATGTVARDREVEESQTLFRWLVVPRVEARWDTRNHELSLSYQPRVLTQVNVAGSQDDVVTGPLDLHRGAAEHVWRFAPGADLASQVFVESGKSDVALIATGAATGEGPIDVVPPVPVLAYTQVGGSAALSLRTGEVESFTLGFEASYLDPFPVDGVDSGLLAQYRLGTSVEYSHYLFRRVDGVLDVSMEHAEFFEEDLQTRMAALRGGLTFRQRRNLTWDARAGFQILVGDQRQFGDEEEGAPGTIRGIFPAATLEMDWSFLEGTSGVAGLRASAGVDSIVDLNVGAFIPRVVASVGLNIFQPWGSFSLRADAGTPLDDVENADATFLPTFYAMVAQVDVPASAYVAFFMRGRFGQRAGLIGSEAFEFGFTEAVGEFGLRLWWSSGRDPRLPRPSETLDEESVES